MQKGFPKQFIAGSSSTNTIVCNLCHFLFPARWCNDELFNATIKICFSCRLLSNMQNLTVVLYMMDLLSRAIWPQPACCNKYNLYTSISSIQ